MSGQILSKSKPKNEADKDNMKVERPKSLGLRQVYPPLEYPPLEQAQPSPPGSPAPIQPVTPPHEPNLMAPPPSPGHPSQRLSAADALRARAEAIRQAEQQRKGDTDVPTQGVDPRPVPEGEPKPDGPKESLV